MSEQSVWDDPAAQIGGDFVQWTNPGDSVAGRITAIGLGTDFNGAPCPELRIDVGGDDDRVLTVGQVRLKVEMLEKRPKVGDHIAVTFTHTEPRAVGAMKHFTVVVNGGAAPGAAAAPEVTVPVIADPAAAQAALDALDPATRQLLGLG